MNSAAVPITANGRDRINSNGETIGTGQLRWEGECGNVTSPFVSRSVTSFGNSCGEEQGTIAMAREVPALGRESACLFLWIPA